MKTKFSRAFFLAKVWPPKKQTNSSFSLDFASWNNWKRKDKVDCFFLYQEQISVKSSAKSGLVGVWLPPKVERKDKDKDLVHS